MNKSAIFFSLTKARLALSVVFSSIAGYILAVDYIVIKEKSSSKTETASIVGKQIAVLALKNGISKVRFDRNGYLYHGRVKALADGVRDGGIKL